MPSSLSFGEAKPRLIELFELLPEDFVYPIEGRHESWFTDEAITFLKQNKHCLGMRSQESTIQCPLQQITFM